MPGRPALADVEETILRQVRLNTAIAQEGLRRDYGANIGKVLLSTYGGRREDPGQSQGSRRLRRPDERLRPAGGNRFRQRQPGPHASLPVIEFAKELGVDQETTIRALLVSNLVTIHLKTEIGRLSAYCGAVSAGCGSGAGIAWLYGRGKDPKALLKDVSHTIVNALAVDSGIVCDGAKASCAAKIASAVDAGLLGFYMYQNGQQFRGGDGIISKGRGGNHPQHWPAGCPGDAGHRPGDPGHHDHPLLKPKKFFPNRLTKLFPAQSNG